MSINRLLVRRSVGFLSDFGDIKQIENSTRNSNSRLFRGGFVQQYCLSTTLHNRDLLIGQAVELIDHLIDKFVSLLNADEKRIEFG